MIRIVSDIDVMSGISHAKSLEGDRICLVPTMGALHEGHLSLIRIASEHADYVVVSIFVNPTQFGPNEDYDAYPRQIERDADTLETLGVDVVFTPDVGSIYPDGFSTYVTVEGLTEGLCGRSRPTHFRGVTTVVTKLFGIVRPHCAVFGRKDAQQLAVVKRMTRDLNLGVEIIPAPIVREEDGLAMSSRNSYLSPDERRQAPIIRQSLVYAAELAASGVNDASVIIDIVRNKIGESSLAKIDYIDIVDQDEMIPMHDISNGALLAVAVFFGKTRLLDNIILERRND